MPMSSRAKMPLRYPLQSLVERLKQSDNVRSHMQRLIVNLGWKQWAVLFLMGALAIITELRNHSTMWQMHGSGQTLWTDKELIWEIFLYGILMPILIGIILGHLGRTAAERDNVVMELAVRRDLARMTGQSRSWHELTEYLVATPGTIVSAERAWLFAQQFGSEAFEQIAYWEHLESKEPDSSHVIPSAVCRQCLEAQTQQVKRLRNCPYRDHETGELRTNMYCLRLSTEGARKAALQFEVASDFPLDEHELKVMEELGAEMALAIDKANLHVLEESQVDIAKHERMRIARDLHDTVGQNVSYLRLKLEQLSTTHLTSDGAEFQDALANMLAVADETYIQVRNTLETLRAKEQRSMEETIRQHANQAGDRAAFSVQVHSSGPVGTLSPRQSREIASIACEALNNAEKHAGAEIVEVLLQWQDIEFRLTVRDDGRGFDSTEQAHTSGYGLVIMQERSRAINANLKIRSTPGDGTEVALRLPLPGTSVMVS